MNRPLHLLADEKKKTRAEPLTRFILAFGKMSKIGLFFFPA
jgi:hypothetical protein